VREILLDIAGDRDDVNRKKLRQYFLKKEGRIMDGCGLSAGQCPARRPQRGR